MCSRRSTIARLTKFSRVVRYRPDYDLDVTVPTDQEMKAIGKTVLFTDLKRREQDGKSQGHRGGRSEGSMDKNFSFGLQGWGRGKAG